MTVESAPAVPVAAIADAAATVDRDGRFPHEALDALRRTGLLGLAVPVAHGGPGGTLPEMVDIVEQVAGACASSGMVLVMHLVGTHTLAAGAGEDNGPKHAALRAIARGEHLTTLAYSERASRGHFWAQVSCARRDGDGVVIDADKSWATSTGAADSFVLAAGAPDSDDPLTSELYLVPADAPGIELAAPFDGLGLRGNASAALRVRRLRVPDDHRLGDPGSGFALMMEATLPWFALGSAACSLGVAGSALRAAVEHASASRFAHLGSALADIPGVRDRLARAEIRRREGRALLHEVARQVADGDPTAMLGVLAIKASAAEVAVDVTDLCLRVGGGAAYSKQGPLERHARDARAASVMAPTTDLLHDFLGRALTGRELFA